MCRGRTHNALAQRDGKIAHHVFAVAHAVADAQVFALLVVQQNGKQIVGNHAADNLANAREQLVEVERLGGYGRDFEQEIEQIAAFAEPYWRLNARRHVRLR